MLYFKLERQTTDLVMDLNRIEEDESKSTNKIIQKINFVASENKKISTENSRLKASYLNFIYSKVLLSTNFLNEIPGVLSVNNFRRLS